MVERKNYDALKKTLLEAAPISPAPVEPPEPARPEPKPWQPTQLGASIAGGHRLDADEIELEYRAGLASKKERPRDVGHKRAYRENLLLADELAKQRGDHDKSAHEIEQKAEDRTKDKDEAVHARKEGRAPEMTDAKTRAATRRHFFEKTEEAEKERSTERTPGGRSR